jgi:hypothetical protein
MEFWAICMRISSMVVQVAGQCRHESAILTEPGKTPCELWRMDETSDVVAVTLGGVLPQR